MTDEQLNTLLEACNPVPLIMLQCGMPKSPEENANNAWCRLGDEMGFDGMTAEPTGKGNKFFTAEVKCALTSK